MNFIELKLHCICSKEMIIIQIPKLSAGDIVELKKTHPCGEKKFKIIRAGSDVRIVCVGCGRDLTMDRQKFEKAIKTHISSNLNQNK